MLNNGVLAAFGAFILWGGLSVDWNIVSSKCRPQKPSAIA